VIDRDSLGNTGTPFTLDVERGKVAEFARAVRATDPSHFVGDEPVVPPTFLATQMHWEQGVTDSNPWDTIQMDPSKGVHAEQEYVFHGPPPRAGERLHASSRIAEIWEKEGRAGTLTFVKMITEFRDSDGSLRAEAILTGVERP
jgi:hypothetical protein